MNVDPVAGKLQTLAFMCLTLDTNHLAQTFSQTNLQQDEECCNTTKAT